MCVRFFFFFFQAEDGIRDLYVTGVQTCALPISDRGESARLPRAAGQHGRALGRDQRCEIGRASCRGKSVDLGGRRIIKKKKDQVGGQHRWKGDENGRHECVCVRWIVRVNSTSVTIVSISKTSFLHFQLFFFFSSRRRHTRSLRDWSSDVCSSD